MSSSNGFASERREDFRPRLLKRSVSTTDLGKNFKDVLNLRDIRSCSDGMEGQKADSSDDEAPVGLIKYGLPNPGPEYISLDGEIRTKDILTNKTVNVKVDILQSVGQCYTLGDIAGRWKKDCRMWLWKNDPEFKRKRSYKRKNP